MAGPKWPHDHTEKHRQAALKGWAKRKRNMFGGRHAIKVERPKPAPTAKATKAVKITRSSRHTRTKPAEPDIELVPVNYDAARGVNLSPTAPPNPYFLRDFYGEHQLIPALSRYSPASLREAAKVVKRRNPGTRPKSTSRQDLIAYIVKYVR